MTSGGKRKGAGRPVGSTKPDRRDKTLLVRLNQAEREKAERIGGGNASAGLRMTLDRFEEKK